MNEPGRDEMNEQVGEWNVDLSLVNGEWAVRIRKEKGEWIVVEDETHLANGIAFATVCKTLEAIQEE